MVTMPSNLARVAASRRSSVALRPCCDLDEQSLIRPRTVNDNNNDNNNDDEQALPGPVLSWQCCRMASSLERQIGDASREATALDCTGEVLLAAGKAEDAAAFHLEAARMHQLAGNHWQEAVALAHLADCEDELGQPDASRGHRAQALTLIEPFSDDPAVRLRDSLQRT